MMAAVLLLAGGLMAGVPAQEALNALVKKCETAASVRMNIVKKRNSKTKALEKVVTTVSVKNDEALVNEFIEAFKKDEKDATSVIEDRKEGKVNSLFYRFDGVSYSLDFHQDKGNANISIIEKNSFEYETKSDSPGDGNTSYMYYSPASPLDSLVSDVDR
jgi:hypothetical protein